MIKTRVRGAFDPITMGFVLALAGAITVFAFDAKTPSESFDVQESTIAIDSAK